MPSPFEQPTPFDPVASVADPIMAAFEEADSDIDVVYCIGMAPWADSGECLVAIDLSTPHGRALALVDRFQRCWLVMHRGGTAGVARPIPENGDVGDLVEECCRFLGGLNPAPAGATRKVS